MKIGSASLSAPAPSLQGWKGGVYPGSSTRSESTTSGAKDPQGLSPDAQQELAKLKERDRQVRMHEAAHIAAGGTLIRSGASYSYQEGPDGKRYAVGGEVSLDTSAVPNNPQATLAKARQIEAAALAPGDPSGPDRAIAAQAAAMALRAASELARSKTPQNTPPSTSSASTKEIPKPLGANLDLLG